MKISNVKIYGMEESIKASKYPMSTDTKSLDGYITKRVDGLGKCGPGTGHSNFLLGIVVQFDMTCSNKIWVEAERYHFLDIISSQSTMHRISKMDLTEQCNEYVDKRIIEICEEKKSKYLETKNPEDYLDLLYNVPSGLELTARMTTNYLQLKTIYAQRKDHRLKEWKVFCEWCKTLPHSEWIVGETA